MESEVPFMLDQSPQSAYDDITTSSRLKAWYMVQFRGYTIAQRREFPMVTRLGRLTYECRWLLRATPTMPAGSSSETIP